jgi:addiction module HigA family antidote
MERLIPPTHPGEVLQEEFLDPMGLSQSALARRIRVAPRRINEIVNAKRGISADTALRLATFFGTSAEFWMGLQADYDLDCALDAHGAAIRRDVQPADSAP